ncbi:G-protein coupled receptor 157 [Denticeps clupeoides]|uniref:G-protein coupled receptor 157 n=1 Tax=Denticeps clupeoides TaxID=299321 RepID=A0AAY4DYT8_9TELE|nr:G-protein coupled receptor 157 [Denticeps clupeoides]
MAAGNETQVHVYEQVATLISCGLSVLGSLLIILTYALWADLRTTPRRLLAFLSIADLLSAGSYFYGACRMFDRESWDCVAQGAISTFSNTSSFFWTVAIALYLYVFIVRANQRAADGLVQYFHLVSWGVPLSITLAALLLRKIGYDASEVSVGWCWVSIRARDHVAWMLLTGKVWEILAYFTLPVLYILIKRHIQRAHATLSEYRPILANNTTSNSLSSMADLKLTLIPIIFIFLRMWSTIRFILMLVRSPARQSPVLVTLHGIGNTFQGAANCIMFVLFTQPIRTRLAAFFCCRNQPPTSQQRGDTNTPSYSNGTVPQGWDSDN